jgi:deoxycytidylate deaminase
MKILTDAEEKTALDFLNQAAEVATQATCNQVCYGAVIVKDGQIIGHGFNSPPGNLESQRRCQFDKTAYHLKVADKTCCVHAEERAVMAALKNFPDKIGGSQIYVARIDKEGNQIACGKPYCTICSKMVLDAGISEFIMWQETGVCLYSTEEYNDLSFGYNG